MPWGLTLSCWWPGEPHLVKRVHIPLRCCGDRASLLKTASASGCGHRRYTPPAVIRPGCTVLPSAISIFLLDVFKSWESKQPSAVWFWNIRQGVPMTLIDSHYKQSNGLNILSWVAVLSSTFGSGPPAVERLISIVRPGQPHVEFQWCFCVKLGLASRLVVTVCKTCVSRQHTGQGRTPCGICSRRSMQLL